MGGGTVGASREGTDAEAACRLAQCNPTTRLATTYDDRLQLSERPGLPDKTTLTMAEFEDEHHAISGPTDSQTFFHGEGWRW